MPYIVHGTLGERLARGPLTLQEAGMILEQIASALQFAHDHGIIHRDIKPSNILLDENDHVYLADFGLAKLVEKCSDITQTDCLIGTPEYMAPELVDEPASVSSDLYALGILLYQMLTGKVPFKAETPIAVYCKHIHEQPVCPSSLNPTLPLAIDQVILCALEKDPCRRFKSVRALTQAYKDALAYCKQSSAQPMNTTEVFPPAIIIQRRIRDVRVLQAHRDHGLYQRGAVLAGFVFLFIVPLWLGFTTYNSTAAHSPLTVGAVSQLPFTNAVGTKQGVKHTPPPSQPKSLVVPPASNTVDDASNNQDFHGQPQHHKHRHRHGHGHGHRHGKVSLSEFSGAISSELLGAVQQNLS
jgi:serine/threonine protein kinase